MGIPKKGTRLRKAEVRFISENRTLPAIAIAKELGRSLTAVRYYLRGIDREVERFDRLNFP